MPVAIQTTEKLYKTNEAAEFLGISLDTIRKHVQRGNLHWFERVGLGYLFKESELSRFSKAKRKQGNPLLSRQN